MVRLRPTPVEITLAAEMRLNEDAPQVYEAPGGLYPLRSRAFELEEYRLMAGWPVPQPRYDIHANPMVSGAGSTFTDRVTPNNIKTGALTRWIPDPVYYDTAALRWRPVQDQTTGIFWQSSVNPMPTLITDYTYRLGTEVFVRQALNFDSDASKHLWADLTATLGGSAGYTVIMVMSPNSVYGNDETVPFNGLWCPGYPSPGTQTFTEPPFEHYVSMTMEGTYLYYEDENTPRTRTLSMANGLNSNAPMYLAMVFTRPQFSIYVGEGPSSIRVKSIPAGTVSPVPLDGHVTLGRTPGDILHTADMALLDLGVYGEELSPTRIQTEFSLLAQSYGGTVK